MILNSTVENPAVLSNVGQIGEFRIRNSAKAFNILSSGLYANKIRAIIRELSCNAVDSHIAAGKADTPFEIHLPNDLEPWFAVRDFGTGLNHDQVTNIYTTYFESTKTASNEFIGALGLGSKSPFSYTDNFTVTAIQSGVRRVYSAFINEEGVPSIALMDTINTDETNGVEIKFSVADHYDFYKFRDEAANVFSYFSLQPVIKGYKDFKIKQVDYFESNITPGVHQLSHYGRGNSLAVMGNIAYPIDMPNADTNLGDLANILRCNLVMHFDIGELDFQASREGLSYIPQTIDAIKRKLESVRDRLSEKVKETADAKTNLWDRYIYLKEFYQNPLWSSSITQYMQDSQFELANFSNRYDPFKRLVRGVENIRNKYNITIRAFRTCSGWRRDLSKTANLKTTSFYDDDLIYKDAWEIPIEKNTVFVRNDTKIGATERARYHFVETGGNDDITVYVMEAYDKNHPVLFDEFLDSIHNPPKVMLVSSLMKKERTASNMNKVGVMQLSTRRENYRDVVSWVKTTTSFNDIDTYYYLPLSNYQAECKLSIDCLHAYMRNCGISDISKKIIYGVRKSHIKDVESNPNWVNLETFLAEKLSSVTDKEIEEMSLTLIDKHVVFNYTRDIAKKLNLSSPVRVLNEKIANAKKVSNFDINSLLQLMETYSKRPQVTDFVDNLRKECDEIMERYPLLNYLVYKADGTAIADYITLIDNSKEGK